jgi:hypothetical protein
MFLYERTNSDNDMIFGIIVPILAFGLLFSAVCSGIASTNTAVYAQQQQQQIPMPKQRNIKITFPSPGQHIPLNSNFTIRGIVNYGLATPPSSINASSSSSSTASCRVIVSVNNITYQAASRAGGQLQPHDYSKWRYVVDPKSTPIKEGPNNRIYARLSCPDAPNLESRIFLNFTGIAAATSTKLPQQQ